jgi:pullulanase/glycogen debranching enzyme
MLAGGDEFARTEMGNNNVYYEDSVLSLFFGTGRRAAKADRFPRKADPLPQRPSCLSHTSIFPRQIHLRPRNQRHHVAYCTRQRDE